MTKKEKIELLKTWSNQKDALDKEYEKLETILKVPPEAPVVTAMYSIHAEYTKVLALLLGDEEEWLEWYSWENDNGKKEMEAKACGWKDLRPIRAPEDLLSLIDGVDF